MEETRLFCHIFCIDVISIGGGPSSLSPPFSGYAYDGNFNAICDNKILPAFLLVCPCVHVKAILIVLFRTIMLNM